MAAGFDGVPLNIINNLLEVILEVLRKLLLDLFFPLAAAFQLSSALHGARRVDDPGRAPGRSRPPVTAREEFLALGTARAETAGTSGGGCSAILSPKVVDLLSIRLLLLLSRTIRHGCCSRFLC